MQTITEWKILLKQEANTQNIARQLAGELRPGDLVTLSGSLGAGKTTFARSLIRALLQEPDLEVPSPTYTLMQTYSGQDFQIVHADLYRIDDPSELIELGWEEAAENAILICEWAEKAPELMKVDRFHAHFLISPEGDTRTLTLIGFGECRDRLERVQTLESLFSLAGLEEPTRHFMQGDASTRSYERIIDQKNGNQAILMISPKRADGPPIRLGKSYSTLVHLAESVEAFIAIANGLKEYGFSAPEIYAANLEKGLLLIEDFGTNTIVDNDSPIYEYYSLASDLLARLHSINLPSELPIIEGRIHKLHNYDLEAMIIEAELLIDWYLPYRTGRIPSASIRLSYTDQWFSFINSIQNEDKSWALRDYHSPNLLYLPERKGTQRIGLLDFQDCVIGHPAYDLVSLLQDARVTIPLELEVELLSRYIKERRINNPEFDREAFTRSYAILGVQRASKILGIFVRLDKRDGKSAYLKHIPRVENYLSHCLTHPDLTSLKSWYKTNLPHLFEGDI